jgi:hypothetical protein
MMLSRISVGMNRMRRLVFWIAWCAVAWLSISAAIGVAAVEGALHPQRLPVGQTDEVFAKSIASRDRAAINITFRLLPRMA